MTRPTRSLTIDVDVPMRARDGVVLRADVYRPAQGGKVPAILLRTPYDKSSARVAKAVLSSIRPVWAAMNGFAFVVQDVRGRYASEGTPEPPSTGTEGRDGYDAIEWVAAQPWCTGRVGMIGGSFASITQWMAAMERPPSLRAIVPERTGGPSAGMFGAMQLDSTVIGWLAGQALDTIQRRIATGDATPADLALAQSAYRDPQSAARHLPLAELPFLERAGLPPYAQQVEQFLHDTAGIDATGIAVPAMLTSGWYDMLPGDTARVFAGLRSTAATAAARDGSRIVFGPWQHTGLDAHLGEWFFGNHASAAGLGLPERQLRFLSRWLRDDDGDIPVATYFVMGANEWREADEWPPPGTSPGSLYLSSGGAANTAAGDGLLSWDAPAAERHDAYRYDPHDPVPAFGGRFFELGGSLPGPFDQSRVEQRADVLVYTTDPLAETVEIAGPVRLRLHASSSAVDTDFMAKLCDVDEHGRSYNIADGFVRCRWREGTDRLSWLTPGEVTELVVDLADVAHAFRPGHRIRLQVTSSCFPAWDRNMNTGHALGADRVGVVADQHIHHGGMSPSALELPLHPRPR